MSDSNPISKVTYKFFADLIYSMSGISIKPDDYYRLDSRLLKLQNILGLTSIEATYQAYQGHINEHMKGLLSDIATNNETFFFRDQKPFDAIKNVLLPKFLGPKNITKSVQIWSCACSTGQEPYSLKMVFKENPSLVSNAQINIDATDISTEALNYAKEGIYNGLEVQRGLPITLLVKYFDQLADGRWKVKPFLKENLKFNIFNLIKDFFPIAKYDLILCRNVLIYQDVENRKIILQKLAQALRPGGALILGSGESLLGIDIGLKTVNDKGALYFQKDENPQMAKTA